MLQLESKYWEGSIFVDETKQVVVSVVAYEHARGIPARFFAGIYPAFELARKILDAGGKACVRIVNPLSIACYCNGWSHTNERLTQILARLNCCNIQFEQHLSQEVDGQMIDVLSTLACRLEGELGKDHRLLQSIRQSGYKNGGQAGEANALLYAAAHPFSWLDMCHESVWKMVTNITNTHFIHLVSKSEERFAALRATLCTVAPEYLIEGIKVDERFLTVCNVPAYLPLDEEPLFEELGTRGHEECHRIYSRLKKEKGENYRRIIKDFEFAQQFSL